MEMRVVKAREAYMDMWVHSFMPSYTIWAETRALTGMGVWIQDE